MGLALLEILAASSLWVAAAAAALCAAAGRALGGGGAELADPVGLAAAGTLVVYNVDRLRDLERDRATTPRRAAFVARHRVALGVLTALAAGAAGVLAWRAGSAVLAVLLPVLALGLAHRRLKGLRFWLGKPLYVAGAWVAVSVGLPAVMLAGVSAARTGWVAALLGAGILANAVASSVRDGEAPAAGPGPLTPLRLARALAGLGVALAVPAPAAARPLALVPLATLAALAAFPPGEGAGAGGGHAGGELYGLVVVDGALLAGALGALALTGV